MRLSHTSIIIYDNQAGATGDTEPSAVIRIEMDSSRESYETAAKEFDDLIRVKREINVVTEK